MDSRAGECSAETWVSLVVAGAGVGLGVGLLDAGSSSEVSLGLAHGWASKEERVCAYYNYNLETNQTERKP